MCIVCALGEHAKMTVPVMEHYTANAVGRRYHRSCLSRRAIATSEPRLHAPTFLGGSSSWPREQGDRGVVVDLRFVP
jgi:hypothetical protein